MMVQFQRVSSPKILIAYSGNVFVTSILLHEDLPGNYKYQRGHHLLRLCPGEPETMNTKLVVIRHRTTPRIPVTRCLVADCLIK
jgi:hypothetical protein